MKLFPTDPRKQRILGAVFVIALVVTTLLTAFFQTQVLSGRAYKTRAKENRLRQARPHSRSISVAAGRRGRSGQSLFPAARS